MKLKSHKRNTLKEYYGERGSYLEEHDSYFKKSNVRNDIAFLIKALNLKKKDRILDIACGQGRHVSALTREGYRVDGVDFSHHLLTIAKTDVGSDQSRAPLYFQSRITNLRLTDKYDKAYWFFSDLANIDLTEALVSIGNCMNKGGKLLIDADNVFRLLTYLLQHPKSEFVFDAAALELIDAKQNLRVPYPTLPMWKSMIKKSGFLVDAFFGGYTFEPYAIQSKRLILVLKKA
jgi:SAM-dependent methyltransferase